MNIDNLIAKRIRKLRKQRGYTLNQIAELSGVSRSMISLIERAETSPTAAVLNKLADALGISLASLLSIESQDKPIQPIARMSEQQVWEDPASGYSRRHLSPTSYGSAIELVEVTFPPGQSVTFENVVRNIETHQQVWMIEGEMEITVEMQTWNLQAGDCLAMVLGQQIIFTNPAQKQARYLVALATFTSTSRGLR